MGIGKSVIYYISVPLKSAIIGLVGCAIVVALVCVLIAGPSSFTSTNSSLLGMEKDWTRGLFLYFTALGAIGGFILGLMIGIIRVLVPLFRRR